VIKHGLALRRIGYELQVSLSPGSNHNPCENHVREILGLGFVQDLLEGGVNAFEDLPLADEAADHGVGPQGGE
jgi:hypothetical protein